ncbi:MAG: aldehyde dehydrogenase family protein [Deltaproteobacteria bacterium]|nr:aldehyde dehydrogenase family protein [Deltaproteobacteria bacterium]
MELPMDVSKFLASTLKLWIGGQYLSPSSGKYFDVENPATEENIAKAPLADGKDVEKAVEAAEGAFRVWRWESPSARAKAIRDFAQLLRQHADELACLDALDSGNPVEAMKGDVRMAADICEYFAGIVLELKGETIPGGNDFLHFTLREPYGVVGRIIPFNHPILFAGMKIAPPLLAGNTLILKPAEQTPLSALRLAELAKDVFPPGTVNIVTGDGPITGQSVVTHPKIKRLALIGSVETGKIIAQRAAEGGIKDITFELGGKNPMIVFPDADLDRAVEGAAQGMNFHWCQGQSCGSTSRLFLHSKIHDEVLARLVARVGKIRIGDPMDPNTEMGCLVSKEQFEKVTRYIGLGKDQGAEVMTGGGRPEQFKKGYFVAPTIFSKVQPDMSIAREEIFGPVLSVFRWDNEQDVIRQANDVHYGLTAAIWTRDFEKAAQLARSIQAGYIWINSSSRHFLGVPFGGFKQSGVGREESIQELLSYTQIKTVNAYIGKPA